MENLPAGFVSCSMLTDAFFFPIYLWSGCSLLAVGTVLLYLSSLNFMPSFCTFFVEFYSYHMFSPFLVKLACLKFGRVLVSVIPYSFPFVSLLSLMRQTISVRIKVCFQDPK